MTPPKSEDGLLAKLWVALWTHDQHVRALSSRSARQQSEHLLCTWNFSGRKPWGEYAHTWASGDMMGERHPLCTFLKGPGAPPSDCGKRLHGSNEKGLKYRRRKRWLWSEPTGKQWKSKGDGKLEGPLMDLTDVWKGLESFTRISFHSWFL